jgi:cystathionine gamma-synthase
MFAGNQSVTFTGSTMKIETLAVHAGEKTDPSTGAIVPPLHLSTTYERSEAGDYPHGYMYARNANPNRTMLEEALATLEGGSAAAAFASGMAATSAVLQALAPGDHVIVPSEVYYGTVRLLRETLGRWGLAFSAVDMSDPAAVRSAVRPETRLVWVETPSNPRLTIVDIRAVAGIARDAGAVVVCDNTTATPVFQRPFEHGADLVVYATTKYLSGHSDILGGAVVAREPGELFERVRGIQIAGGAVAAPFDCWLLLRSIKTLPYRMRAHGDSAMAIARFLDRTPSVTAVHYPGLESSPGHRIALRQMSGFGGLLSFEVEGGRERALRVAAGVGLIHRATSFGGVHTLIEHRASIEPPGGGTPEGLLRLSVGLEHPDDLIEDLRAAIASA